MGAWGTGSFENDDALDWVHDLCESKGTKLLLSVFDTVKKTVASGECLDASDGTKAQAAGEVVAALLKQPVADLPENVHEWLNAGNAKADPRLTEAAAAAVRQVLHYPDSELKQLWDEAAPADAIAWKAGMNDLLNRLRGS